MAHHQQILFDDIFDLRTMNDHGKKFEKINRLHCKGTTYDVDLVLDVNSELFSTKIGDRINISLASTLSLDGTPDDGSYNPNPGPCLADSYDYVMHGRIFSIKHIDGQRVEIQSSFGGLLLRAIGEQAQFDSLLLDMNIFLLMRKGGSDIAMNI